MYSLLKSSPSNLKENHDTTSHVYTKSPGRIIATEILRLFNCPSKNLSHHEILEFVEYASKNNQFNNQLHMLLAVDSLRSLDCVTCEKEILMFSNSLHYKKDIGYTDSSILTRHNIFKQSTKALLIMAYFNLILGNFKRAKTFMDNLFQLNFASMPHGETYLQWTVILKTQIQVSELDIYAHNAMYYFSKNATLPKIEYVESAAQISKIITQFENRLFSQIPAKKAELSSTTAYKLLALSFIVLKCRTMSAIGKCRYLFVENYKRVTKYMYENIKCRIINKSLQCVMRSFASSNLHLAGPNSLKYCDHPIFDNDSTGGHCTESSIIENVIDIYEYAYQGEFEHAAQLARVMVHRNRNVIIGRKHVDISSCLLDFDSNFFCYNEPNNEKLNNLNVLIKKIYEVCPAEAILRDAIFQLFIKKSVDPSVVDKIEWMIEQCTLMGLWPVYRVRCHIVLGQILMAEKNYQKSEMELLKGLKLATKHSAGFILMIRRRLSQLSYLTGKLGKCIKYLNTLRSDMDNHKLPLLEEGMVELNQFILRFKLKGKIPPNMTDPEILLTYLNRADSLLKPFKIIEKYLLGVKLIFFKYLSENKITNIFGYDDYRNRITDDIKSIYTNNTNDRITFRRATSNSFINLLSKTHDIPMYLF